MPVTINDIFKNPENFKFEVELPGLKIAILRPLLASDVNQLAQFLESLSPTTQHFYKLDSFDFNSAKQICDDINRYDKVRFITEMDGEIVGLFEFSMDLTQDDIGRYMSYGIKLKSGSDCRFGPCISDKIQGSGFATAIFPYMVRIANELGQERIILWGGVFENNHKAIKFYKRNGFKEVGNFRNSDNQKCIDMIIDIRQS